MAVVVRLRRMGTTNKPYFRIVAADERTSNNGRFLETLGWYAPRQKGVNYEMNMERIDYWKGVGARTTETVDSLIRKVRRAERSSATAVADDPIKVKKVADLPQEIQTDPSQETVVEPAADEDESSETPTEAEKEGS